MIKITTIYLCLITKGREGYTADMSVTRLPKPTVAPLPRNKDVWRISLFYAVILTVMAVAQLFTFDHVTELFIGFDLPGGEAVAYFLASFIVATEVLALPFLIRMPLSPAFRWVSMVAGWAAAVVWLKVTIWLAVTEPIVDTVGFLGTAVNMMPGWWAVFISLAMVILAAWASWGMWPGKRIASKKVVAKNTGGAV